MSETETMVGKLIPEPICESLEKTAERILLASGWEKDDCHNSFVDALQDAGYQKYYITDIAIFRVEMKSDDPYADIFHAVKNADGSYDFVLKFHNGGCSFGEAVDGAIKNIEDDK